MISRPHVCLATCAALPELDEDERLAIGPLQARGMRVSTAVWDDPSVDWAGFDLVVIRSTWDYTTRRDEFVAWARSVEQVTRLANRAGVIAWNTDKRYLRELEATGVPVVRTSWLEPGATVELPSAGIHVIKPAIGAGSLDAERFDLANPPDADAARAHAERLLASGQTVMVQPYLSSVDEHGEAGLVFLRGEYSHAITKSAMLGAPKESIAGLYKAEVITERVPSAAELALARRTLAALPWPADELLYARVDMLADACGEPVLIELELTEPSLFMAKASEAAGRLAESIRQLTD
jgi:glutathione synthase/RimK-type ligase-like ATP-grasp enzyme